MVGSNSGRSEGANFPIRVMLPRTIPAGLNGAAARARKNWPELLGDPDQIGLEYSGADVTIGVARRSRAALGFPGWASQKGSSHVV